MKSFTLAQWIVIVILSLLTALEPLSIDLYLPGFLMIADAFGTSVSSVQISLSAFLGGFAIGQLIWGPLADRFGRKKPILISLVIFTLASVACIYVKTIEQLWIVRFIQAIGGCGGIVISRAVVTDYFDTTKTLKIFALLALIMGVAPIIAPSIGNGILRFSGWEGLFGAMVFLGIALFFLTLFLLPETNKPEKRGSNIGVIDSYLSVLKVRKFLVYSIIAGIVNGALMIYVANGPFLIMEKGGFSNTAFGLIFSVNALGLMISSLLTSYLQKYMSAAVLVKKALLFMTTMSVILVGNMYMEANIYVILIILFFYVFPIGVLFPATTEIAITSFTENAGTASALFGAIQLAVAFVYSLISNYLINDSIMSVGVSFFLCCVSAVAVVFIRRKPRKKYVTENLILKKKSGFVK